MIKKYGLLLLFVFVKFLLQYQVIAPEFQLHRDEYLHLDQAHHLAWGYTSVPPFTSWVSWLIFQLGNSEFWVKFFPALFGVLTLVLIWKTVEALKGGIFAQVLAATTFVFSGFVRMNMLYQPNSFDILAWTACFYLLIKYLNSEESKWLYFLAVAFALGFLNKYNIVFLLIGLLPALAVSKHRVVFLKKEFYLAILMAFLLILPNVVWQLQNDFPMLYHMKQLTESQLVNQSRLSFLVEQLMFVVGSVLLIFGAFVALLVYKPFKTYRFLVLTYLITLAVYVYLKAKGYYAFGLYPVFYAFGAVFFEGILKATKKVWLRPALVVFPVLFFALIFRIIFPIYGPKDIDKILPKYKKYGLAKWEDGKEHTLPQDFADMLGWKPLATLVDSASMLLPQNEYTLILCDNYGEAGAINFYSKNKHSEAVSFSGDYLNWFDLDRKIVHVILVQDPNDSDKERKRETPMFEEVIKIGEVKDAFAREYGSAVFVLKGAKVDVNQILRDELKAEKQH
jgi:hypothetical protein